jgi:Cytidylate kinase-like family/BON domain
MALLLISRCSSSGGILISGCLEEAGWKCLTREDLIAAVNRHGELANRLTASIEKAAHDYGRFSTLRRPYKILTQLALLEYAIQGNVAYFGYSGHLLLPGIPHAVRVRLLAPVDLRVRLMRDREEGLTEEEARERIRQQDDEHTRWTRFMYGKNLRDPELFDLCINLEHISFDTVSSMLEHAAQQKEFRVTRDSMAALDSCYLCAQVLAALVTNPQTSEIEVGATAEDGRVVLEGPYLADAERELVLGIAKSVRGVTKVEYREGYAPPFDMTA